MSDEKTLILAGIGGQGLQVAGKALARAAVYEKKRALYFSLFDGAQRGGVSDCAVAISTGSIQAPPLMKQPCDALMAMDPNGLSRYEAMLRPGGVLVYNASIHEVSRFRYADMHNEAVLDEASPTRTNVTILQIAATELGKQRLGSPLMAALICLGALITKTEVVSLDSCIRGLQDAIRPGRHKFLDVSAEALRLGAAVARGEESPLPESTGEPAVVAATH